MTQTQPTKADGLHLILNGYGCPREPLEDLAGVLLFLEETPGLIGMTIIRPAWAMGYQPPPDKPQVDWGISRGVLIAESHIALHTFPARGTIFLDIFSCKPFDFGFMTRRAVAHFQIARLVPAVFPRGLEYPPDQDWLKAYLGQERRAFCSGGVKGEQ